MGNDKKLKVFDAECYSCKEIIVPIDEKKTEDNKQIYSCPNCGTEFTIETTIVFEPEEDEIVTYHWQVPYS